MPHVVCPDCIIKLNSFNDFYETSLKTESVLKALCLSSAKKKANDLQKLIPPYETGDKREGNNAMGRRPKRTLNCFIVHRIASKVSVFTCRHCFRTFTTQSAALTHSCVEVEECEEDKEEEEEEEEGNGKEERSLPPLKIRLFSIKSGFFVCYLCDMQFEKKAELVKHIKEHFIDEKWENNRHKKKRRESYQEGTKRKTKKKRKKWSNSPEKEKICKTGKSVEPAGFEGFGETQNSLNSPGEETERMTEYSETFYDPKEFQFIISPTGEEYPEGINEEEEESADVEMEGEFDMKAEEIDLEVEEIDVEPEEEVDVEPEEVVDVEGEEEVDVEQEGVFNVEEEEEEERKRDGYNSEEVIVLDVITNASPFSSACIFCDKIFDTKETLVNHQNGHLMGYFVPQSDMGLTSDISCRETVPCSLCGMNFANRAMLVHHEQFHAVKGHREMGLLVPDDL